MERISHAPRPPGAHTAHRRAQAAATAPANPHPGQDAAISLAASNCPRTTMKYRRGVDTQGLSLPIPAAQPPARVAQRHAEQLQVADVFFGDLVRGPLTNHIAERGCQRSAQREQHRDICLRHGDLLALTCVAAQMISLIRDKSRARCLRVRTETFGPQRIQCFALRLMCSVGDCAWCHGLWPLRAVHRNGPRCACL